MLHASIKRLRELEKSFSCLTFVCLVAQIAVCCSSQLKLAQVVKTWWI